MLRTLSVKGGINRSREAQVILPMHRSIAELRPQNVARVVDFSALICTMPKKSRIQLLITRVINLVKLFS